MSDPLDDLTEELIAFAMGRSNTSSEATAALISAGFAILVSAVGREEATTMLGKIVEKLATRVAN